MLEGSCLYCCLGHTFVMKGFINKPELTSLIATTRSISKMICSTGNVIGFPLRMCEV